MKLGVLFSGGKDSCYAAWLAKKEGNEIECLISVFSENKDSFMFHTPGIELTKKQAELMGLPIIICKTKGEKEKELGDLEKAIGRAAKKYVLEGIVTGALASEYQASRIGNICKKLGLKCINPLWGKNQLKLLEELLENKFEIIISGVAAYPLDKKWIGREINNGFIKEMKVLAEKYKINIGGEGGETESLVLNCPLFKERMKVKLVDVVGEGNAWRGVFENS